MKTMKEKSKIILWRVGAFFASIAPILVAIGFNWQDYTATVTDTVKLSAGSIIVLIFLFLKSMGKLKLPEKKIILYLIIFSLAYLLESIMNDLVLISGMALLGEIVEMPIEKHAQTLEENLQLEKQAEATAKQVAKIQNENSGRV